MKKKTLLGVTLSLLLLSGCAGKDETAAPIEDAVATDVTPTETEPTPVIEEVSTPNPTEESKEEVTPTPEPVTAPAQKEIVVPDGYSEYTYGSAPLSSVYVFLCYADELDKSDVELVDIDLNGLPPEEFMAKLDESLEISPDLSDEEKEQTRSFYLVMALGFSGLTDGSEEQKAGFFEGTWVPDGTDYMAEYRQEDGSIHIGSEPLKDGTAYTIASINGTDYSVVCQRDTANNRLIFDFSANIPGDAFVPLELDGFSVDYNGADGLTLLDASVFTENDKQDIVITYEGDPADIAGNLWIRGLTDGAVYWVDAD